MVEINVSGGTAKDHSTNLCLSCKFALVREAHNGKTHVQCQVFSHPKEGISPTVKCSAYEHKAQADLHDMKQMAWVITPGREHLGFRPLKVVAKEEGKKAWEI